MRFRVYDPGREIPNMKATVVRRSTRSAHREPGHRLQDVRARPATAGRKNAAPAHDRTRVGNDVDRSAQGVPARRRAASASARRTAKPVFGRGCLFARRLVEAGIRAVEVTLLRLRHARQQFQRSSRERTHARSGTGRASSTTCGTAISGNRRSSWSSANSDAARRSIRSMAATIGRAVFRA